ncbi:transposase [Devosia sp. UYZn731]|uniref:transposase n=1 Tax=Devosia sp. UYZn731 TaxID=3156345 RepID=UPI003394AB82
MVIIGDETDQRIPDDARACLRMLEAQLKVVKENDRRVRASARETELDRRLMEIPGVGSLLASAFVATVADAHAHALKSGRCLSAWIGLVPKQNSSGGKEKRGSISKAGNQYSRQMLVVGAMAVIGVAQRNGTKRPWLVQLLARRTTKVAAVALAKNRPDGLGTDDQRRALSGAGYRKKKDRRDRASDRRRRWKGRTGANA